MPFEIPKSWVWTTIEEVTPSLQYGTSEKSKSSGDIAVLRMGNITRKGTIDYSDLVYTSNKADIEKLRLKAGDILFNRTNSSEWVGKTAIYRGEVPSIYAGYIIRMTPIFLDCEYVNMVMNSQYERNWCNFVKTDGVNQSNINSQKLGQFYIPIPPIEEQKRIVKTGNYWLHLVESIESNKKDIVNTITKAKQEVLRKAICGELVSQDPTDEPAPILLKRINPNIQIPCDNPHYQNIPQSWCICTMADIAVSELGKTLDKEKNKGEYKPYLCSANVLWNRFDLSGLKQMRFEDDEKDRYSIKKNDLIICEGGDAGRCAVWTSDDTIMFQNALHRVRFYHGISPYYIMYVLMFLKQNGLLEEYCKGVTIKHFTKTALSGLQIPLPPISEQYRIVSEIEEYFWVLSNIETAIK